jgi:hypothetical protein
MTQTYYGPATPDDELDTQDPPTWRWRNRLAELAATVTIDDDAFVARVILPKETLVETFDSPDNAFAFVLELLGERGDVRPRRRL